jgi:hypothetical protein
MSERIDYAELPGGDLAATKTFYASAFGWGCTDYGPTYAGFENAGLDGGLAACDAATATVPLVLLKTDVLEGALARVEAAGGEITAPIFEFPGGHRFHFSRPRRQRARRVGRVNDTHLRVPRNAGTVTPFGTWCQVRRAPTRVWW